MAREVVDAAFVENEIGKLPIIDVRGAAMYAQGHIPTAHNVDLGAYNSRGDGWEEEFTEAVKDLGIGADDEVIVYCQMGMHATMATEALEKEGFTDVRLYLGSFADWSSDPTRPVEA